MAAPTATLPPQVQPPELALSAVGLDSVTGVDVVALPVWQDDDRVLLGPGAAELADRVGVDLLAVLDAEGPGRTPGKAGEVTALPVPSGTATNPDLRCVLLVGVGEGRRDDFRRAGAALARAVKDRTTVATSVAAADPEAALEPFVVGAILGSFLFHWRSSPPEHPPVRRILLAGLADGDARRLKDPLDRAVAIGRASWRARMLSSVPANLKTPAWLADQARELADEAGLEVTVWDEQRLAEEGFGGILGVGQASVHPPRLVRMDYRPVRAARSSRRPPTVVLVGKGITFDTGGLSIKPGEAMVNMKRDMTGGAVVMTTMAALADVGCPVNVVGLVAAAENAVSGNALRPGDVVRHYGGRTSEITNTDAEGRVVLADALAYAAAELDPAVVVDVATLTGAVKVALGQQVGGLFATDDALAAALFEAGTLAGEPVWRFPLAAAYEEKLTSKVADADNAGGGPGAITAALFLKHFVGEAPWAHLDIASTGDAPEDRHEWTAGQTGFGTRLLLQWLGCPDPLAGVG